MDASPKIFVGGLPTSCDEAVLSAYFCNFGNVMHVEVKRDMATGGPRGFGFVTFESQEAVDAAVAMNGQHIIESKSIEVKQAMARGQADGGGSKGGAGKSFAAAAMGCMQSFNAQKGYQDSKGLGYSGKPAIGKGKPMMSTYSPPQQQYTPQYSPQQFAQPQPAYNGKGIIGAGSGLFGPKSSPKGGYDPGKGSGGKDDGKSFDRDDAKIFVGGLPQTASEEIIFQYFSAFGTVAKVDVKKDPLTNASRGFCFVTFEEVDAAFAAIGSYDQHNLEGKWIEVKSAMVNGKPAPGQKGGQAATGTDTEPLKIFVGGIPKTVDEERLTAHFSDFGSVTEVLLKRDETGMSKGFAFVSFADEASVAMVINNQAQNNIDGVWIDVKSCAVKGKGSVGKGFPPAVAPPVQGALLRPTLQPLGASRFMPF